MSDRDDAGSSGRGTELFETVGPHDKSEAMPAPIVESIRRYRGPDTDENGLPVEGVWGDYTLPEMMLPGFGGEKYDDCGDELIHCCKACGNAVGVGRTCDCSTCSRCAASWCRRRASEWAGRLMQLKGLRYAVTGDDQYYHHLTISPPDMWAVDGDAREAGRAVVRTIMQELGVEGVALYHPFRGADEPEPENHEHPSERYGGDRGDDRDNDDRDDWKGRLFQGREWADVRDELKFDPHWHVVCVGGFVRGGQLTKAVEDATDWVIHRITPPDPSKTYSIRDDRGLARALAYCYSHAGLRETDGGNRRVESLHTGERLTSKNFEVSTETAARAEQLVREEAWATLGIPSATMTCHDDHLLPPEEDEEEQYGSGDGDGEEPGSDGARLSCGGALVRIDEYDDEAGQLFWEARLNDDEWLEQARYPVQAREALAEWRRETAPDSPIWDVLTAG